MLGSGIGLLKEERCLDADGHHRNRSSRQKREYDLNTNLDLDGTPWESRVLRDATVLRHIKKTKVYHGDSSITSRIFRTFEQNTKTQNRTQNHIPKFQPYPV